MVALQIFGDAAPAPVERADAAEVGSSVAANRNAGDDQNLIPNGWLQTPAADKSRPEGFTLTGAAAYVMIDADRERVGRVVRFSSTAGVSRDGELAVTIGGLSPTSGRWFRFRVDAMAEDGFAVGDANDLALEVAFFRNGGDVPLDHVRKPIYPQIVAERAALVDPETNRKLGRGAWRSYDLDFHTPFPEVDTLRLSVTLKHRGGNPGGASSQNAGKAGRTELLIDRVELTPIPVPADYQPPAGGRPRRDRRDATSLAPLGGRWYFDPAGGRRQPPAKFDHTNSRQLFYLAHDLEAPFADNMSAWLRKGFLDASGEVVKQDRLVEDSLVVSFTATHLVVESHALPNHPTAQFPDFERGLDGNPNYIREQRATWRIPLEPRENPSHKAMQDGKNSDRALPMGPIGVAVNGVPFFNPFDQSMTESAIVRLDRCCGHPAPNFMYHYHKYPACVKSPWSDDGAGHSPLIGFAFDGYPVYGPYEAAGELAKNSASNPLNEFNGHEDKDRGWHYHVTPGQFPHILGGYWGNFDESNRERRPPGGPGGRGPGGPGGRGPGGPEGGPGNRGPRRGPPGMGPPPDGPPPGFGPPPFGPPRD